MAWGSSVWRRPGVIKVSRQVLESGVVWCRPGVRFKEGFKAWFGAGQVSGSSKDPEVAGWPVSGSRKVPGWSGAGGSGWSGAGYM